ncbi:MAG: FAD-dependent oxidoreductase [Niabella sp.]
MTTLRQFIFIFINIVVFSSVSYGQEKSYDVVIYGATSSGMIAAYAAAKGGVKVAVLSQNNHVGGLTTSGLGSVDKGVDTTIGGYTLDFFKRVGEYYNLKGKPAYLLTPSIAEATFKQMAKETGVDVYYNTRLIEKSGVISKDKKIQKIITENGMEFAAKVFIDASYEGDLMAWSHVPYIVGRESRTQYGESEAGRNTRNVHPVQLSSSEIRRIKSLEAIFSMDYRFEPMQPVGSADNKTQAYGFRLTLTQVDSNKVPFKKPGNYSALRYQPLLKKILNNNLTRFDQVCTIYKLPQNKTDINHLDLANACHKYPDGSYKMRDSIWYYYKDYTEGYLYFVSNDPNVPEVLRKDALRYGYAKDEFTDNDNWPYLLYAREGRRMIGKYVMRQQDAFESVEKSDVIGMGSYFMDSHEVQRTITPDGYLFTEGGIHHIPYRPYQIPYSSLVPNKKDCQNLIVSTCVSASHVIYGSLRMEPVFMIMGHAAGNAAALCVKKETIVQNVNIQELQNELIKEGQVMKVNFKKDAFITVDRFDGIILDDVYASFTPREEDWRWVRNQNDLPFMLGGFHTMQQTPVETASATYVFTAPTSGKYNMSIMYAPAEINAQKALISVISKKHTHDYTIDMTQKPADGYWQFFDVLDYQKNDTIKIKISNQGPGGRVCADALKFVKQ